MLRPPHIAVQKNDVVTRLNASRSVRLRHPEVASSPPGPVPPAFHDRFRRQTANRMEENNAYADTAYLRPSVDTFYLLLAGRMCGLDAPA